MHVAAIDVIDEPLTTGGLAQLLTARGCRTPDGRPIRPWMVRRMFELGLVGEANGRLGTYRIIRASDLPAIVRALEQAGYLPAGQAEEALATA